MPVTVTCTCGATYHFKDEFAGQLVQCTKCSQTMRVSSLVSPPAPPLPAGADGVFARDQFLLRQKHLSISAKYYVWDERGNALLFVERPAHFLRNLMAALAGVFAGIVVAILFGALAAAVSMEELKIIFGILAAVGGLATLFIVSIAFSRKRDVNFYRDDTKRELLLQIFQDKKVAIIHATYTVADAAGAAIAKFDKNYIFNLFRKRWYCSRPDGSPLCVAKEDSIILSLLRRLIGPLFGLLRTNFIIVSPHDEEQLLGEFNRKLTILDRYSLDLSSDPTRTLDRRIALALGVMLDTGERR